MLEISSATAHTLGMVADDLDNPMIADLDPGVSEQLPGETQHILLACSSK